MHLPGATQRLLLLLLFIGTLLSPEGAQGGGTTEAAVPGSYHVRGTQFRAWLRRRSLQQQPDLSVAHASLDSLVSNPTLPVRVNQAAALPKAQAAAAASSTAGPGSAGPGKAGPGKSQVQAQVKKAAAAPGKLPPPPAVTKKSPSPPPQAKSSPPAGKKSPPPSPSKNPSSPPPPADAAGRAKLKKMVDAIGKKFWQSSAKEYDTFWRSVTDAGYDAVLSSILQKNYAITILWPNNRAMKYATKIPDKYRNQRLGFHILSGLIDSAKLNRAKQRDWWRTAVHWPSASFSAITPVVYKLSKANETLLLGSKPSDKTGAKVTVLEVYKDTDILIHEIDLFMEPYRYWNNLP